jgi:DNA (cytosine-5)-methyltransferase 1
MTASEVPLEIAAATNHVRLAQASGRLRVVDLFAGAGGFSEGFRQAGFDIAAGMDIDPDACATYAANFPCTTAICGDVRQPQVREAVMATAAGVDVVIGGPPCQAFSQVRNHSRLIDDPRNSLYREFVATVKDTRPTVFLMENVPGMAQMGVRAQVEQDLALDGEYEVNARLVDAADFGVPQTRKRLIFLGVRRGLGLSPLLPTGTGAVSALTLVRDGKELRVVARSDDDLPLLDRLADPNDTSVVSAAQAISDLQQLTPDRDQSSEPIVTLPVPDSAYQRLMRVGRGGALANVSLPRINRDTVARLNGVPPGGNYRDLPDELRVRYISGQKWGPSNGSGNLGRSHYYAYRRLHPSIWGWTLNTKADSVYHYHLARSLSVREFARLQSFPDRFLFTTDSRRGELPGRIRGGAAHSRYRQVGNAVPPLLAAAIAREIATIIRTARQRATQA